jgi:hypothetical protein
MAMNAGDESHVKLLMFGTNDGFRVFQSTREADMHVFREMREAPDGEYARYVTPTIGHSSLYFFCRVGRKYGKGLAVFSGDMKASNTVVEVSTVIFMQENEGGRNVNAESYRW